MFNRLNTFKWNQRTVSVLLPKDYTKPPQKHFPVVITQDGDYLFKPYRFNAQSGVIFIGITPLDRDIEYTPWDIKTEIGDYTGKADQYIQMLIHDFIPVISNMYRIDKTDIGLAGGSFGALVSLYAVLNYSTYFKRCILLSPSLWYPGFLNYMRRCPEITDQKEIFWYVGGQEALGRQNIMGQMIQNNQAAVLLMADKLKHPDSKLIFMTNHNGIHRHRFFIRYFKEAVKLQFPLVK